MYRFQLNPRTVTELYFDLSVYFYKSLMKFIMTRLRKCTKHTRTGVSLKVYSIFQLMLKSKLLTLQSKILKILVTLNFYKQRINQNDATILNLFSKLQRIFHFRHTSVTVSSPGSRVLPHEKYCTAHKNKVLPYKIFFKSRSFYIFFIW